jgi:TolB-like protein
MWHPLVSCKPGNGYTIGMIAETIDFGPFVLDRRRQVLTRNGEAIPIGHRGYVLLETLLDAEGEPVDKAALMERAWPGTIVEEGNLTVQIATLRKQLGGNAEALIVTVPRVGYRLVAPAAPPERNRTGPPLIAVLPFANLGSEAEQGYFAHGVVDDIIIALSRFKTFAVISRGSSFALRNKAVDARTAAAELGVRYVLEGSVRRMADRVRVSAQLVDAHTGADLWAEKFDGAAADIFEFQDRITESVVGLVEPEIRKAEIERARRKRPENLDAYDLFLRAVPLVYGMDPVGYPVAIDLLSKAAALDPGFALAPTYAAWTYEKWSTLSLPPLTPNDGETCLALARTALASGGDDPLVRGICGWVLFSVGGEASGRDALRQAMEANPNNLVILTLAGAANLWRGSLDTAYECYLRGYQLSPGAADAHWSLSGLGMVETLRGNYEAGIEWSLRALATFNEWPLTYRVLAAAYAQLGRMDEAAAAIKRLREIAPHSTLEQLEVKGLNNRILAGLLPGLRKAGLPER